MYSLAAFASRKSESEHYYWNLPGDYYCARLINSDTIIHRMPGREMTTGAGVPVSAVWMGLGSPVASRLTVHGSVSQQSKGLVGS